MTGSFVLIEQGVSQKRYTANHGKCENWIAGWNCVDDKTIASPIDSPWGNSLISFVFILHSWLCFNTKHMLLCGIYT